MKLNFRKAEIVYALFFTAIGIVLFYQSSITKATVEEPLTAAVYGMIISALFLVATVSRLIRLLINKKTEGEESAMTIRHPRLIFLLILGTLAYTCGIVEIGYYVVTLIFTAAMVMALRDGGKRTVKAWVITILGCLVFTVALYGIFTAFKVYLPNAWLI